MQTSVALAWSRPAEARRGASSIRAARATCCAASARARCERRLLTAARPLVQARLDGLCVDDELMMGGSRGGAVALREVRFRSSACPRSPMPLTPASRRPNRRHPSRRVPPAAPQVAATGEAYRTCPHRSLAGGWVDGRGAVKRVAAGVNVVGGTCYPPRVWACARVPAALRIEF